MFSKVRNITLAVAAVAAVGAAVLVTSTSSADARGFGGGGFSRGGGHIGGGHIGGGHLGGGRIGGGLQARVPGRVTGFRPGIRIPNRPGIHIGHRWPHYHPNWCRFTHRCGIHVRWYRPWVYGGVAATTYAVAPTVAAAAAPSCTCLKKEYTPDNLVVFSDVCTKEVASAPIGNTQVQLPAPQQGPVQQ